MGNCEDFHEIYFEDTRGNLLKSGGGGIWELKIIFGKIKFRILQRKLIISKKKKLREEICLSFPY